MESEESVISSDVQQCEMTSIDNSILAEPKTILTSILRQLDERDKPLNKDSSSYNESFDNSKISSNCNNLKRNKTVVYISNEEENMDSALADFNQTSKLGVENSTNVDSNIPLCETVNNINVKKSNCASPITANSNNENTTHECVINPNIPTAPCQKLCGPLFAKEMTGLTDQQFDDIKTELISPRIDNDESFSTTLDEFNDIECDQSNDEYKFDQIFNKLERGEVIPVIKSSKSLKVREKRLADTLRKLNGVKKGGSNNGKKLTKTYKSASTGLSPYNKITKR